MPLHLHHAQRSDALVSGLARQLLVPLADPMATEIVSVPARGIERWLTQRLSHELGVGSAADGVCANVNFDPPGALVEAVRSAINGSDPATDPWRVDRLMWPLLEVIDAAVGQGWCAVLAAHVGALDTAQSDPRVQELRRGRRLGVAARIAGLFVEYGDHRPELITDWLAGRSTDGGGRELGEQWQWQPELFRRVREVIGQPSPAETLTQVCDLLRSDPERAALPERLSIFGPTRLSTTQLRVLDALALHRDVHVWIPQPSADLWSAVEVTALADGLVHRADDPTAHLPRHPLLRSLGRDSRELQVRLRSGSAPRHDHAYPEQVAAPGVLGLLQRQIADNQPLPDPADRDELAADDRSIAVHACHGRDRQVEVLREVLVGLLADDPTLQPRDILVMCPDIEVYAPLILAAFSPADATGDATGVAAGEVAGAVADQADHTHPGTGIRVRLADRALRRTNPVLDVLARLLELADSRMTASDVLDFAALPPVRRRFGFDNDDTDRLQEWVISSGIRWGLNAKGRERFGLSALPHNTWRAGLDRILLGVAMAEDEPVFLGSATPLDDVDSSDIDLAGRLAELVDRLAIAVSALTGVRPLADWIVALTTAIDSLAAVSAADAWQVDQAHRMIGQSVACAGEAAQRVPLRLSDIVGLLADALRGKPTRANFRTGELTICSMVPMRSVPHRVVCLMGLDDGEFPRTGRIDGDDVLAADPVLGERDRTSEDRQLLLDAIGAATENLVFLYSGADVRTGAQRPPAAALGEILDVLDATVQCADGGSARERLVVRHPLQPFDSRNFVPGELVPVGPFSFDAPALAAARAGRGAPAAPAEFLPAPLPAPDSTADVELAALIRFFEAPPREFLRERLGLQGSYTQDETLDELDVDLNQLQQWHIGEHMLAARLAGFSDEQVRRAERRRGTLPPGDRGEQIVTSLGRSVEPLVQAAAPLLVGQPQVHNIAVPLPDGRSLIGSVSPLRDGTLTSVSYSRVNAKSRIRAWISIVALAASDPGFAVRARLIGRGGSYRPKAEHTMVAPPPARAAGMLADLVAIRDQGLLAPLPLMPKSAVEYAQARHREKGPDEALERAATHWDDGTYAGEGSDWAATLLWGRPGFAAVVQQFGPARHGVETSRFGELAVAAYWPLLIAENLGGA